MRNLRGCLAVLSPRQWSFAVMRTGVYSGLSFSRAEVARRVVLSRHEVRRLEREVLRTLRTAERAHGCDGMKAPAAAGLSEMSSLILTGSVHTAASSGDAAESRGTETAGDGDETPGPRSVVAGVFESGPMPGGIGVSLLRASESVSALAVGTGVLLLMAAALLVYRRRTS